MASFTAYCIPWSEASNITESSAQQLALQSSSSKATWLHETAGLRMHIHDIGGSNIDGSIRTQLREMANTRRTQRRILLPDELLYNDEGLQIWSDIIHTPEYYQFRDETEILQTHGSEIAAHIPSGAVLIDLGAGDTTKVSCLISALTAADKTTTYLALDISKKYLELNCQRLTNEHPATHCHGLWGTFSNGMQRLRSLPSPRVFLSLGSVLCNDEWSTALGHLRSWAQMLRSEDLILIGMDGHVEERHFKKIWTSYHPGTSAIFNTEMIAGPHETYTCAVTEGKLEAKAAKLSADDDSGIGISLDPEALYEAFWRNGFEHANRLVGEEWFKLEDWDVRGLIETQPSVSHRFVFSAKKDLVLGTSGLTFKAGDEFDWFDAHKYGPEDVHRMCELSGLQVIAVWKAANSDMHSYLVKLKQ